MMLFLSAAGSHDEETHNAKLAVALSAYRYSSSVIHVGSLKPRRTHGNTRDGSDTASVSLV
jgi:hypothetical protein